ncbi:GumC family protein [Mesorhizobium australicum]|uniref:Capsular exopolysaccharide family n=1 Tax=Mesorhizobium australicum TaxID=536018 RepID=A0A1X7NRJ8_9HYPH|nr:polysaccharide biosynthesis tyrosine autokinase [Mesorhizobium australicum]SMH40815.1 capsular exopolysaccharide family [Mesorhizobium australicum]
MDPMRDSFYGHPQGYGPFDQEHENGFNPLHLLIYVVQYRWLITFLLAMGLVSGVVITLMQTPKYQATAQLEVMSPSARVIQDLEVISETSDVRAFLTARERLRSRSLAQRVVYELGLSERADFLFPAPDFSVANIFNRAFGLSSTPSLENIPPEDRERIAVGRVLDGLSVELVTNTSLISITFRNQSPDYASKIANQVAQSYIDQRVDNTSETSGLARQFIQEQVLQVKERLQESERALVQYAKEQGITVTGSERSLIAASIEQINTSLSKAVEDRLNYGLLVQQIDAGRAASLQDVLSSEGLQNLRGEIAKLRGEYQQKLPTFKPGFPEMVQLRAQIDELSKQYDDGVTIIAEGVKIRFEEAVSRENDLREKIAELEKQQIAFQDKNIQYTILRREVDSNRSQYDSLISKLNEAGVGSELRTQTATLVDNAVTPRSPFSPRLTLNLAIALALGMMISAAVIYLLELLNNTFVNPDQVEKGLGLPVMGVVPLVDDKSLQADLADPQSALSEAYRSLRTSLQFSGAEGMPKTLMITSAEPSEGKSTTVYKLAEDFAALGQKVLVIDADLRKPNMHRLFKTNNTLGLSNLLTNSASREDLPRILRQTAPGSNVWIMSSGTIPPNPADLLSSARMAMLLNSMSTRFDLVLVDAPPVVGLSDAPLLGRLTQAALLVVSSNQVSRNSVKNALKRLRAAGTHVVGASLSKFSIGKFDYNYAYKYMNYSYYAYGNETPKLEGQSGGEDKRNPDLDTAAIGLGMRMRAAFNRVARRLKPAF